MVDSGVVLSMFIRRVTAVKLAINEILDGDLITDADGKVVGVETRLGQVSRVNVIATVVDRFDGSNAQEGQGLASLTLDDGTGVIRVKMWGEMAQKFADINVGDLVLVIGRVRSFQGETYLNGEVIRYLDDPNWETVRLLELAHSRADPRPLQQPIEVASTEPLSEPATPASRQMDLAPGVWQTADTTLKPQQEVEEEEPPMVSATVRRIVLQTIEAHDGEGGARFEQIMDAAGDASEEEVEQVLIDLLSEGLVYEPEIHRYKKS